MILSFGTCMVALVALVAVKFLSSLRQMRLRSEPIDLPSVFFLFPMPLRFLIPNIPILNPVKAQKWEERFDKYERMGDRPIVKSNCPGTNLPILHIGSAQAAKTISINRKVWTKPVEMYKVLSFFGPNLVITEGPVWKSHRKIVTPSFSEAAYSLVWTHTVDIFDEALVSEGWGSVPAGSLISVKDMVDVTMRLALLVIARAAFAIPTMAWKDEDNKDVAPLANGHTMTSSEALHIVSTTTLTRILMPKFMYKLPIPRLHAKLDKVDRAFNELDSYMLELIQERREQEKRVRDGSEIAPEKEDLFGSLVRAAGEEREDDGIPFSDREVVGNTFIFLLAGHETSGHTLSFLFALLALNPDAQARLHEHVSAILPDRRKPVYEDFQRLNLVLGALYEAMRMFPPVVGIPKTANEDTTLTYQTIPDAEGNSRTETVFVPKGTDVLIDTPALHHNPMYWDNPKEFRPERFLEDYEKDAFIPFSAGPRACVGRRFAEVEAVGAIALFVQNFEFVAVPHAGETHEQMSKRLLRAKPAITLTPYDMDLVLKRR